VHIGKGHGEQDSVRSGIMVLLEHHTKCGLTVLRLKGSNRFVFGLKYGRTWPRGPFRSTWCPVSA
jgi:hypothetical protein